MTSSLIEVPWGGFNEAGEKVFRCHPGQSRVLRSQARFTAAIAGTGGGKTVIGPLWCARQVARLRAADPDHYVRGMVIAPTYPIMKRATVPTLAASWKGTDLEGEWIGNEYRFEDGILWLVSADNPDGIEGGQVDFAWVDEGGQITFKAWLSLCQRTGVNEAPILVTTTPYSLNWLKYEILERYLKGDEDYLAVGWESIANPAYPRAEFERAQRSMSKTRFDMRYRGIFARSEGLVYPDIEACVVPVKAELPQGAWVGGMDWGFRDPFVALFAVLYPDELGVKQLYIHGELYKRRASLSQVLEQLPKGVRWYCDPSRPDSIKELRLASRDARPANNAIAEGIAAVTARIYTRRLQISDACVALLEEAKAYEYPEEGDKRGKQAELPVGGSDHAMDALRYLVMGVDARKKGRV